MNATTEALTMQMTRNETIADYTTRFINKCEQAELSLEDRGIVERFVASMTPEIYHQVAASWLPLRKSQDPKVWNVNEAANVARELLGDVVEDYYNFYDSGRMGLGRNRVRAGPEERTTSEPTNSQGTRPAGSNPRRQVFDCKYHGKNLTHSSVDCEQRRFVADVCDVFVVQVFETSDESLRAAKGCDEFGHVVRDVEGVFPD